MKWSIQPSKSPMEDKEEVKRFMKIHRKKEPDFFDNYDPILIVTAGLSVVFVLFMFVSLLSSRELFRALP